VAIQGRKFRSWQPRFGICRLSSPFSLAITVAPGPATASTTRASIPQALVSSQNILPYLTYCSSAVTAISTFSCSQTMSFVSASFTASTLFFVHSGFLCRREGPTPNSTIRYRFRYAKGRESHRGLGMKRVKPSL